MDRVLDRLGRLIARQIAAPSSGYRPSTPSDPETLRQTLRIGDVLLVEANQKVGRAIKYLTQSTWSHAALYVGDLVAADAATAEPCMLVEANLGTGVKATPISHYRTYNTRICRPVGLSAAECEAVARFAIARIGMSYDTRNVIDLARYLMPTPPVPARFRRRMLALGSGEPTRYICSTLIAQAFQSLRYPILPMIEPIPGHMRADSDFSREEVLHIRHHSLFTPRDFDISPYFQIVKPTIEHGFDHRVLVWDDACHIAARIAPDR